MASPALAVTVGTGRGYVHPVTQVTVPSVTTILQVLDKPALPRWAAKSVAEFATANKNSWVNLPDDAAIDLLRVHPGVQEIARLKRVLMLTNIAKLYLMGK